jgi:hypothetical protein
MNQKEDMEDALKRIETYVNFDKDAKVSNDSLLSSSCITACHVSCFTSALPCNVYAVLLLADKHAAVCAK